jgi:hypothetical protein
VRSFFGKNENVTVPLAQGAFLKIRFKFLEAKMKKTCVLCGGKLGDIYGHNPDPLSSKGRCCGSCNTTRVIPARLERINNGLEPRLFGVNIPLMAS